MTQKDVEQAAKKTVDYLYKIEGDCPPKLYEAISMLRQLINEEFKPAKLVSNQIVYDILYPKLSEVFVSKDKLLKTIGEDEKYIVTPHSKENGGFGLSSFTSDYVAEGRNELRRQIKEALGIGETE